MADIVVRVLDRIERIPEAAWDELLDQESTPFMTWRFLEALESTGCVVPDRRWFPRHLTVWQGERLLAAAPAYVKVDSAGDFSRDWAWANAAYRAGIDYYPKLILSVPITPVPGRRILVAEGEDRLKLTAVIVQAARQIAEEEGFSSVHVHYCREDELADLETIGLRPRHLVQFHWHNDGYSTSADWLARLRSKPRNQIKRERREPTKQGISIRTVRGDEVQKRPGEWARLAYRLYRSTTDKYMWGGAYLTQGFFERLFAGMPEATELVVAERAGEAVAGAFNVATERHLYGRYWGCFEEHRFLHFNVCLYHSIDECIERGIQVFEGGAGGSHKLKRGFEPTLVHSAHLFLDPRFDHAVGRFLEMERRARREEVAEWRYRYLKPDPAGGSGGGQAPSNGRRRLDSSARPPPEQGGRGELLGSESE